jgi:hypothetical protein
MTRSEVRVPHRPPIKNPTLLVGFFIYLENMDDLAKAKELSNTLRSEADKLLAHTDIVNLLAQFGDVNLGGSYKYGLLIDRDLDFGVTLHSFDLSLRQKIANLISSQPWVYGLNMSDRISFKPLSNLEAPRGLYLGLTVPFPTERWNIDIWFTLADFKPDTSIEDRLMALNENEKNEILLLKYKSVTDGTKIKGMTSFEIYKKVLGI